ncbi:MAG TPA: hypothetical protein VIS94_01445 [Desulfomonilia bacterium]
MVRKTLNNYQDTLGGRAFHVLSVIVLFMLMLASSAVYANDENKVLEKSGIVYPGGFDMNTLGEIKGRVAGLIVPQTGPVTFGLKAEKDTYMVIASPAWYWRQTGLSMSEGDNVTVRGSKSLGRDSNLYIIAQDIKIEATGQIITLRNNEGKPVWSNASRMSGSGSRGSTMQHGAGKASVSGGQRKHGK